MYVISSTNLSIWTVPTSKNGDSAGPKRQQSHYKTPTISSLPPHLCSGNKYLLQQQQLPKNNQWSAFKPRSFPSFQEGPKASEPAFMELPPEEERQHRLLVRATEPEVLHHHLCMESLFFPLIVSSAISRICRVSFLVVFSFFFWLSSAWLQMLKLARSARERRRNDTSIAQFLWFLASCRPLNWLACALFIIGGLQNWIVTWQEIAKGKGARFRLNPEFRMGVG